ncbi:hypothetical protein [Bacillus sp. JCM 19034]|uniref:hypothetical protein n=1 Tax=Bacillus sp. JCM 19034 TaxID=1481928 RepID=UPI0007821312|nr:hypothetical protein [Bacillus sp. JCM 19034]
MYLLDKVTKVDERKWKNRCYIVEGGKIRYATSSFQQWNRKRVNMNGTLICNGRIYFEDQLLKDPSNQHFSDRQKQLIKEGCTTIAVAPYVKYESELPNIPLKWSKFMERSTIDYVVGLTVPVNLVRPSFIRKCQNLLIPFLKVEIKKVADIHSIQWTHISHSLLHYPLMLIPIFHSSVKRKKTLYMTWKKYCLEYGIHTELNELSNSTLSKTFLQKIGLFPQKGTLIAGSDLDYIAYINGKVKSRYERLKVLRGDDELYERAEPDLVVLRGKVLKVFQDIDLDQGYGQRIKIIRPGRFLSMNDVITLENGIYR